MIRKHVPCKTCRRPTQNRNGYCDAHQAEAEEAERKRLARFKRFDDRRGSPSKRGYDATWRRFREVFLMQNPLCVMCQKEGRLTPANEVHHVHALRDGGERLNPANCMALCHGCHSKITVRENRG